MANAVKLARESRAVMDQAINAIGALGMMKQKMEDHGQRFGLDDANAPSHGEGASNDALAADEDQALQSQLFDTGDMEAIDSKIEELKAQVKKCNQDSIAEIEMAQAHVREVLNEHDFIRKLLGQDKHATMKQMEVMAFPRQEKTRTRILQIDELLWLEARYDDEAQAAKHYPQARRVGRGTKRLPNADVRSVILEIFHAYHELLKEEHKYTIYQAVKKLLKSEKLPRYDAIAVDEVQDLALLQVRLVMKLRRNDGSSVYISGDEDQKIYQRDFTWKQLDSGVKGHTITLDENKRNGPGISEFANRLTSNAGPAFAATASQVPAAAQSKAKLTRFEGVELGSWDDEKLIRLLANLQNLGETTAVIGKTNVLVAESKKLSTGELSFAAVDEKPVTEPGLYECRAKKGKGLEFDNVVVDYSYVVGDDYDEEKRLRYVHFTRPRKRLSVRYPVDDVPQLLLDYYADCLPGLGND